MYLSPENTKILISCHKACELPADDFFLPVEAGSALKSEKIGFQCDDECMGQECDNISRKNMHYCELTVLYWAWKNIRKVYPSLEYIGLNHYRRFFIFGKTARRTTSIEYEKLSDINLPLTPENISLEKNTIITPRDTIFSTSLYVHYCTHHYSEDYRILRNSIKELYPDYYDSFIHVFEKNYILLPYNMFIMSFDIFEDYCEWLFNILKDVESKSIYKSYNQYQQRIFGYMSERLFNVYIHQKKIKIKQYPIAFINPEKAFYIHKNSIKSIFKNAIRELLVRIRDFKSKS